MTLTEVQNTVNYILNNAITSNERLEHLTRYRYIADYYRHAAEPSVNEPKEISLNNLAEYPDVDFQINIIEDIAKENDLVLARNTLNWMTDWAYRYGSLKGNYELPDVGEAVDKTDELIYQLNDKCEENKNLTINDVFLALKLTDEIIDQYGYEEFDQDILDSEYYEEVMAILDRTHELIQLKDDGRLNWDMMGKTLDTTSQRLHEELREQSGKREILRELREFESDSIEEYLEQRDT